MEKRVGVSAKYIPKKCILGKIQWRKIAFGVRYNGEKLKSLGKIHRKTKSFIWKNIREKKAFEVTYNGEKSRGFGKIHTKKMHSGQNTMEKNCIWGKIQWRKGLKSLGKIHRKTKSFIWKNIREKRHLR